MFLCEVCVLTVSWCVYDIMYPIIIVYQPRGISMLLHDIYIVLKNSLCIRCVELIVKVNLINIFWCVRSYGCFVLKKKNSLRIRCVEFIVKVHLIIVYVVVFVYVLCCVCYVLCVMLCLLCIMCYVVFVMYYVLCCVCYVLCVMLCLLCIMWFRLLNTIKFYHHKNHRMRFVVLIYLYMYKMVLFVTGTLNTLCVRRPSRDI